MANAPRLSVVRDQSKPRKLGRYELEESLGADSGLETFRARVRGLAGFDRIFAVKCLHRPRGSQINLADPYIKTARRLASINDPRIARVLDADVIDGLAVAVTEFVHGLDLDRFRECAQFAGVLATGSDETAEKWQKIVAYIGAEVAGGLAVMHALSPPLVHAGLCPRNIIATARGGIKILDAGLAYAANVSSDTSTRRSASYAAKPATGAEPSTQDDMRAFGAILFELATGELPSQGSPSALARRALDAIWPSMADFIAGLLAEDPALRPTASEAARILADYWAEIPDASMVSEIAGLVRNLSAFVADAGLQTTAPPIVQEPKQEAETRQEPTARPARAEVFSIAPPPPAAISPPIATSFVSPPARPPAATPPTVSAMLSSAASEPANSFHDEPTVVRSSGSYAAALFQAAPTDNEISELVGPPSDPIEPLLAELGSPPVHATLMAYPAVSDSPLARADEPPGPPPPPQPMAFPGPAAQNAVPELADWGARALAALGDQAGVSIAPPPPPPAKDPLWQQKPPPPVSDPTIEEAFAFTPPSPADTTVPEAEATFEVEAAFEEEHIPSQGTAQVPVTEGSLLEDELVDDAQDMAAFANQSPAAAEFAETSPYAGPSEEPAPLIATAFAEEEAEAAPEWASQRMAQEMSAPREDDGRHPATVDSPGSDETWDGDDMSEIFADSGRKKRIAIGIVIVALIGGGVAGALAALGVFGKGGRLVAAKKHSTPAAKTEAKAPPPVPAAGTAEAISPPVAKVNAQVAAKTSRVPPAAPAGAASAKVEAKVPAPATSSSKPAPAGKAALGSTAVSISVASTPPGAAVWIDGQERGTTPCSVSVARGSVRVTLVRSGYLSHTSAFEADDGKAIEKTLEAVAPPLEGEARFRAECKTQGKLPIVIDGRETGILCPNSKLRVDPGPHSIGVLVPATGKVHAKEITLSAGVRSIVFGD